MSAKEIDGEKTRANEHQVFYGRLAALSWLHFLNDGSANFLPGVLPALLLHLKLHVGFAGTIMAALLIGQALQAVTGWLADKLGGRKFIALGILGSSISGALIGFVPSFGILIPLLVIIGISNAFFHPQALAGARRLSQERQGFGLSLFLIGGEIGRGLWPFFASLIVSNWGLRALWLMAIPALISTPLLWNALPVQSPKPHRETPIAWGEHIRPMTLLVLFSSLRALMIFGIITYLPILWHNRGYSLVESSSLISVLLVVGIIGNIGGGHLSDLFGRKRVILGAILSSTVLLTLFILIPGFWRWAILGLLGISLFATLPISLVIGQNIFPENPSLGSGIALGVSNGIGAAALILLGLVAIHVSLTGVLWTLVGVGTLATILSLTLPE
ncbi:MFS transporter [Acidihalobacter prosperus]